jgi:hypothetical protein
MLKVRYVLAYEVEMPDGSMRQLTEDAPLVALERRGILTYHLLPGPFTEVGVAALNASAEELIAGGQWFQLWRGQIIGAHTPEDENENNGGGDGGRLRRGSLVDQAPGSRHR